MRLRVGVLGASHDHLWRNLRELAEGGLGRLIAAAEPDPALRERLAAEYGGVDLHAEYEALLERRDLDAALVFADQANDPDWELGDTRIAKLWLQRDGATVYEWDRGLGVPATDPVAEAIVDFLAAGLADHVYAD